MNSPREPATSRHGRLHALILRTIIDTGRAPTVEGISAEWGLPRDEVRALLGELQQWHGAVLHPASDEIWIIHPFSAAPSLFSVHAGGKVWWANCAWCGLGAAALIGQDCRITSSLGAHGERVDLEVRDGEVVPGEILVHFPVPMARVWDNVLYACSTMLLFERESDIDDWSDRHGIPKGDVRRVSDLWPFAREWYGGHLSESWEKISVDQARAMFARHGLDGPIWTLPDSGEQF